MEPHQERSLIPQPSHELTAPETAGNRILGEMVESSLALAKDSAVAAVDLEALVREGERLYCSKGGGMTLENKQAFALFLQAAEGGHPEGQFYLGFCYQCGDGVQKNEVEASKWYLMAAEQGNANAQIELAGCYLYGDGVPQDDLEAVKWYRKAAEQGNHNAQIGLGHCYDNGDGVPQDHVQAVKWFRKAAEQGDYNAQYLLGVRYRDGKGVPVEMLQAYKWFQLAADRGLEPAEKEVKALVARMSPSELQAAQRPYQEFKDKYPAKR